MPKRKNSAPSVQAAKKVKIETNASLRQFNYEMEEGSSTFWVVNEKSITPSPKIAAFDMDWTLIFPKSGKKFPTGRNDWKWWPDGTNVVEKKLKELHSEGYRIVILTNQNGIKKGSTTPEIISGKITDISEECGIPFTGLIAGGKDGYRKPCLGGWEHFCEKYNDGVEIDKKSSFFCGDAAGRPKAWKKGRKKDFNSSDRKYAENLGLKFYTPDAYFLGERECEDFSLGSEHPETFLENAKKNPSTLPKASKTQEMVLMVGWPASGKSTIAKNILGSYSWINRDTLKTMSKCKKAAEKALKEGKSCVVDNTNPSKNGREVFLSIAKKQGVRVRCFWMQATRDLSTHMNSFRRITTGKKRIPKVAYHMYNKKFEAPQLSEGFESIEKVEFAPKFENEKQRQLFGLWGLDA